MVRMAEMNSFSPESNNAEQIFIAFTHSKNLQSVVSAQSRHISNSNAALPRTPISNVISGP
jgi:hypothetical protein